MAIKLADTLKPMGDFPIAEAQDIMMDNGKSVQDVVGDGVSLDEQTLDNADVARTYHSISDLNYARPDEIPIELIKGEDNTSKIVSMLHPRELFIDWFGNTTADSRFGIPEFYGTRINQLMIFKQTDGRAEVTAVMNTGKVLTRFVSNDELEEWKTSDGEPMYTNIITLPDNILGFDINFEGIVEDSTIVVDAIVSNGVRVHAIIPLLKQCQDLNSWQKERTIAYGDFTYCRGMSFNRITHPAKETPSGKTEYSMSKFRFLFRNPPSQYTYLTNITVKYVAHRLGNITIDTDSITSNTWHLSAIMAYRSTNNSYGGSEGGYLPGNRMAIYTSATSTSGAHSSNLKRSVDVTTIDTSQWTVISYRGHAGPFPLPYENKDTGEYVRFRYDPANSKYVFEWNLNSIPQSYQDSSKYFKAHVEYTCGFVAFT